MVTTVDSVSLLMAMVNQGMSIPLAGTITLRDSFGDGPAGSGPWWGPTCRSMWGPS